MGSNNMSTQEWTGEVHLKESNTFKTTILNQ